MKSALAATTRDPLFGLRASDRYQEAVGLHPKTVTFALTAAPGTDAGKWHGVMVVEGVRTRDRREVAGNALGWRTLPLPIMALTKTTYGHQEAKFAGGILTLERVASKIEATGYWDSGEVGEETARLVADGTLRFVSVDLEVVKSELIEVGVDLYADDWLDDLFWTDKDRDAFENILITTDDDYDWWERITEGYIMGATVCPFPAFEQAVIAPEGTPLPETSEDYGLPTLDSLLASAVDGVPPSSWFDDPHLTGPTHLTVTPEGRVLGHLATWEQSHIGHPGAHVYPPKSQTAYAYFRTGSVTCLDGDGNKIEVPTGPLTLGTGHANPGLTARPAAEHYDHTGTAVADVAVGEDAHGIWLAGALRPGVTEDQVRVLKASDVSGDWREVAAHLELVAALVVNVAGFPIPRSLAAAASELISETEAFLFDGKTSAGFVEGRQVSLTAAGLVKRDRSGFLFQRLARELVGLRAVVEPLRGLALREIAREARGE